MPEQALSTTEKHEFEAAQCHGKQGWPSPQAVRKAYRNRKDKLKGSATFHCEFCGKYHIGHVTKKKPKYVGR